LLVSLLGGGPAAHRAPRCGVDGQPPASASGAPAFSWCSRTAVSTRMGADTPPRHTCRRVRGDDGKEAFVVEVSLPGIGAVAEVDLDVSRRQFVVTPQHTFAALRVDLEDDVLPGSVVAKFKKKKGLLRLELPVDPAAAAAAAATATEEPAAAAPEDPDAAAAAAAAAAKAEKKRLKNKKKRAKAKAKKLAEAEAMKAAAPVDGVDEVGAAGATGVGGEPAPSPAAAVDGATAAAAAAAAATQPVLGLPPGCAPAPPRPRSALKARGSNGNAPCSSGRDGNVGWQEVLQEVRDIEASGSMNPTPPRGGGGRGRGGRAQQASAGAALMADPEVQALLSQPGVMEPLQELMSNPQVGLAKHSGNMAAMMAFFRIQEKMKVLMSAPAQQAADDGNEGCAEEEGEASAEGQAIAVLLRRGRAAVMRGDVDRARGALKAGLEIDMSHPSLKTLALEIKEASASGSSPFRRS
jgi:hypothetical protein